MGTYSPKIPKKKKGDHDHFFLSDEAQKKILLDPKVPLPKKLNLPVNVFSPLGLLLVSAALLFAIAIAFSQLFFF